MSLDEKRNKRNQLFKLKQVKNSIMNERSRSLTGTARIFLQNIKALVNDMPFGVKWIFASVFDYLHSLIINFKDQIPECPDSETKITMDIVLFLTNLLLRACVLPAINDSYT